MSKTSRAPAPDQESFLPPQQRPSLEVVHPEEEQMPDLNPTFGTTETPVKASLVKRIENLYESLCLLGGVNQRYGLERGSDPDNPSSRDILLRRYGGGLEEKVEEAKSNRDTSSEAKGTGVGAMAREHFYTAFGHLAMLSGMLKEDVDDMRDREWDAFRAYFLAQPHGLKRRSDYTDKLQDS